MAKPTVQSCWIPPEEWTFKANYDVAMFTTTKKNPGIEVVVRDHTGKPISAFNHFISLPPIVVVEAKTMVARPVNLVMEISIKKATFEGESKTWKFHEDAGCLTNFGKIIDDAKYGAQELERFRFIHTWHQGNVIKYNSCITRRTKDKEGFLVMLM